MTNAARQIINTVRDGRNPIRVLHTSETSDPIEIREELCTDSFQMAEMGAIRMFMKMRAFDKIPLEGSVSY
jgi:hypothetical protein